MNDHSHYGATVRVEITDEPVIAGRSGSNERGPWTIPPKQPAYIWQGERYPTRIEIPVPANGPYRPGLYLFAGPILSPRVVGTRTVIQLDERNIELVPLPPLPEKSGKAA